MTGRRVASMVLLLVVAYGCTSSQPAQPAKAPELLRGVASWYGEEFAGRTTANGEIFDPLLLTAAHRTLPFGTIADITNPKTGQKVRVRVNDRGPYIGNRIIDLSYAAAQQIGLIEPGVGEVEIAVVQAGKGDREPPAPFVTTIAAAPRAADSAPAVPVVVTPPPPKPAPVVAAPPQIEPVPAEVVIDTVEVQEERGGVATRRQVSADGRSMESVPVDESEEMASTREVPTATVDRQPASAGSIRSMPARKVSQRFIVQVGAFSVEANAKGLQERLASIGQKAYIDREALYRVRIGPFAKRDEALAVRTALESNGISAIIVAE